jgi:predicted outer membrane protein
MAEIVLGNMAESQGGTQQVRQLAAQLAHDHKQADKNLHDVTEGTAMQSPTPFDPEQGRARQNR